MSHVIAAPSSRPEAIQPPAIALRELAPWALFAVALLALVYLVGGDQNASLHEWMHDGRHLLGFPCH